MVFQLILVTVFLSVLLTGFAIWSALQFYGHPVDNDSCCLAGRRFWTSLGLAPEFQHLLLSNASSEGATSPLFLLEPYLLGQLYKAKVVARTKSLEDGEEAFNQLKWRFDLTDHHLFNWQPDSLVLGIFAEDFAKDGAAKIKLESSYFFETRRVVEKVIVSDDPQNSNKSRHIPLHVFYERNRGPLQIETNSSSSTTVASSPSSFSKFILWMFGFESSKNNSALNQPHLKLHLVIFHQLESFLYVGAAPLEDFEDEGMEKESRLHLLQQQQNNLNNSKSNLYRDHFTTTYPMTFDAPPLLVTTFAGLAVPREPQHLLGQLPSARYLHCSLSADFGNHHLYHNNSINVNQTQKNDYLKAALQSLKSLLSSQLYMNWWLWSRTLISWRRQCTVPMHLQSDHQDQNQALILGTWSSYATETGVSYTLEQLIRNLAPANGFHMISGGEGGAPYLSLKHSTAAGGGDGDYLQCNLHFTNADLDNGTTFLFDSLSTEYNYPQSSFSNSKKAFTLCSASLVGVKVLVPCELEADYFFKAPSEVDDSSDDDVLQSS